MTSSNTVKWCFLLIGVLSHCFIKVTRLKLVGNKSFLNWMHNQTQKKKRRIYICIHLYCYMWRLKIKRFISFSLLPQKALENSISGGSFVAFWITHTRTYKAWKDFQIIPLDQVLQLLPDSISHPSFLVTLYTHSSPRRFPSPYCQLFLSQPVNVIQLHCFTVS